MAAAVVHSNKTVAFSELIVRYLSAHTIRKIYRISYTFLFI